MKSRQKRGGAACHPEPGILLDAAGRPGGRGGRQEEAHRAVQGLTGLPEDCVLISKAAGNRRGNPIGLAVFILTPFYTECVSFAIPEITVGKLDFGAKNIIGNKGSYYILIEQFTGKME